MLIPEHERKTHRHPDTQTPTMRLFFQLNLLITFLFDTITIQNLCKKTLPLGIEPRTYRLTADRSAD